MKKLIFTSLIACFSILSFGQTDSLIFKNGNYIVGEIKSMNRGVITIETDYSDSDFKIEWEGIQELYSDVLFLISTKNGDNYYGTINATGDGQVQVQDEDAGTVTIDISDVVYLNSVDKGFLDRIYAGIDLGLSLTKARNQRQFTLRSRAGYLAEKWALDAQYNTLDNVQDDVEDIRRTDGFFSFRYILPHNWYLIARVDFLSNTEQLIDLRSNLKLGAGKFLRRTNSVYWAVHGGASWTNENYFENENDLQSSEGWFGTELNLYDIGDFSMMTNLMAYPSFSESGRWRVDYMIDLQYDLPLDFYIKTGLTLNFDNQPVEGASRTDYVWQTGFGWEW